MPRRYKEARQAKKIKLTDAADILGVSQPALSAWEGERKSPSIDNLIRMAEEYEVSTDYLLGVDGGAINASDPIPAASIRLFHGKPVWIREYGWAIVDATNKELVFVDKRLPITDVPEIYASAARFSECTAPTDEPLSYRDAKSKSVVWVEPVSNDEQLRQELRGRYTVKERYVENEYGAKFYFDTYEVKWLAFEKE